MFARTDTSTLGRWWWTVDRWLFAAVVSLMLIGGLLIFAASPAVAERIHLDSFYFVKRHLLLLGPAFILLVGTSLLSPSAIRRFALLVFIISFCLLLAVPFVGVAVKGATRWLSLFGFSLQPSEFIKPTLAVLCAWMFAEQKKTLDFPGNAVATALYVLVIGLLLLQPDLGMVILITVIWFGQFFLSGLSARWILMGSLLSLVGLTGAYIFFPHVTRRVDQFFSSSSSVDRFSEGYQISQSLESLTSGGFFGQGPGEGVIKRHLPDAHADFIFSVAGEEFGMVLCLIIVGLFAFIFLRGFMRVLKEDNFFVVLAVSGLVAQVTIQAMINIASSINLIPTKGMTLPFISYGGSSLLAMCIAMGMVLGLTRRRFEERRILSWRPT